MACTTNSRNCVYFFLNNFKLKRELSYANFDNEGKVWSLKVMGMFAFTSIVIITNVKILTFTNTS